MAPISISPTDGFDRTKIVNSTSLALCCSDDLWSPAIIHQCEFTRSSVIAWRPKQTKFCTSNNSISILVRATCQNIKWQTHKKSLMECKGLDEVYLSDSLLEWRNLWVKLFSQLQDWEGFDIRFVHIFFFLATILWHWDGFAQSV